MGEDPFEFAVFTADPADPGPVVDDVLQFEQEPSDGADPEGAGPRSPWDSDAPKTVSSRDVVPPPPQPLDFLRPDPRPVPMALLADVAARDDDKASDGGDAEVVEDDAPPAPTWRVREPIAVVAVVAATPHDVDEEPPASITPVLEKAKKERKVRTRTLPKARRPTGIIAGSITIALLATGSLFIAHLVAARGNTTRPTTATIVNPPGHTSIHAVPTGPPTLSPAVAAGAAGVQPVPPPVDTAPAPPPGPTDAPAAPIVVAPPQPPPPPPPVPTPTPVPQPTTVQFNGTLAGPKAACGQSAVAGFWSCTETVSTAQSGAMSFTFTPASNSTNCVRIRQGGATVYQRCTAGTFSWTSAGAQAAAAYTIIISNAKHPGPVGFNLDFTHW